MVIPVLVLPQIFEMDGVWLSISAGELLSLVMSIYYFVKFREKFSLFSFLLIIPSNLP